MFFVKTFFWISVVAIVMPQGTFDQVYASVKQGQNYEISDADYGPDGSEIPAPEKVTFCGDFPTTCSLLGQAKTMVHVQAIAATASLHEWLVAKLEAEESEGTDPYFEAI